MSRVGKKPVKLMAGAKATLTGEILTLEGPKGTLKLAIDPAVAVAIANGEIHCSLREAPTPDAASRFGLVRSLVANMAKGVSEGFSEELEVVGVGYRCAVKGQVLELALGFSHPVSYPIPTGITILVEKLTFVKIMGADKQLVGQTAAEIRTYRMPEPYKGKGIKYAGEVIRRKAGKAAAATAS